VTLGRILVVVGIAIAALGLLVMLGSKLGLPRLGRLPGDIVWRGRNTSFYFPIVTCLVLSVVLTLILSFINRLR
jgi:hypothetical protein